MLELNNVSKQLGGRRVLRRLSLVASDGDIHWLRGANGCGKSTLLRCVAGIWRPDAGDIQLFGRSLVRDGTARRALGYVPESFAPFPDVTAAQALRLIASLRAGGSLAIARDDERLDVAPFLQQPVASLSAGQLRRVALRAGLLGDPWLLLLDEPTNGLDGEGLHALGELLLERKAAGKATLLVTHDESFGDRLGATRHRFRDGALLDE